MFMLCVMLLIYYMWKLLCAGSRFRQIVLQSEQQSQVCEAFSGDIEKRTYRG